MASTGQNKPVLPRFNVYMSDRGRARLERLARMRSANLSRVVEEAVVHLLATVELGEPVRYIVPSEQHEDEGKADKPEE